MHIVHIITRFIRGGADENTLITCNGQAALGHDVTLICGHEYDQKMLDSVDSRVNIVIMKTLTREISPLIDMKCYSQLVDYFKKYKPDIVHTHESKAGILGRLAARVANVKFIVHGVHILAFMNANRFKKNLFIFLEKIAGYFTNAFLHVSPAMKEQCQKNNIGNAALHEVIPSGMDLKRFRNAKPSTLDNVKLDHIPENTKFLIMSGTLEERKRVKNFLYIFKNILSHYPNVMLLIAGDGSERDAIENEAERLSIRDKIIVLGYTSEIEGYIARANIGVHAALHEGLPRVVLQYLASGKPVAMTHLEGIDYVVKNESNGYIVQELHELEEKILSMLKDEYSYAQLANGAENTDLSRWDHQNMINGIEKAYMEIFKSANKTYICS